MGLSMEPLGMVELVAGMALRQALARHKASRCARNVERTLRPNSRSSHTGCWLVGSRRAWILEQQCSLLDLVPAG